jgi:hypothetical protein
MSYSGGAPPVDGGIPPADGGVPPGGLPPGHPDVPRRPNIRFIIRTSRSRNELQFCPPAKYRVILLLKVCILTELAVVPLYRLSP